MLFLTRDVFSFQGDPIKWIVTSPISQSAQEGVRPGSEARRDGTYNAKSGEGASR